MTDVPQMPELRIDLDRETALGKYANFALFSHQKNEFYLDFALLQPNAGANQMVAVVNSRVITSPAHAKALLRSLAENIQRYEDAYGVIPEEMPGSQA